MKIVRLSLLLTAIAPVFVQSAAAQSAAAQSAAAQPSATQSSAPAIKSAAVSVSAIQSQSDIVLSKKKLTGDLADEVFALYEINPKHPATVEKAHELRGAYKSLLDENIMLLDLLREYRMQTQGKADPGRFLTLSEHVKEIANHSEIDGKIRQLEFAGFDLSRDRTSVDSIPVSVSTNTSNAGGSLWGAMMLMFGFR
jgi:hypothetical protein